MVVHGRLQLLPCPTRVESGVEQVGGEKALRTAHASDGREPNPLHLDGSRCALYSCLSSGRYEIITRYYRAVETETRLRPCSLLALGRRRGQWQRGHVPML